MVERVEWFSPIHYEIMEFFGKHDIWINARGLSENIDYDRNYTSKECVTLTEAGLLEKQETIYSLTEQGRAYLAGGLDGEIREPRDG